MSWTWNPQGISPFLYTTGKTVKTFMSRVSRVSRASTSSTSSTVYTPHLYSGTRITPVLHEAHTDLCLTLASSLKASVLRAYTSSTMCDNLVKRAILTACINHHDIVIMSCSHCVQCSVECQVSCDSEKCGECVCCDVHCNTGGLKLFNWSQLNCEQEKICSTLAEAKSVKDKAHSHIHHLKKQKELLDHCEDEMIQCGLKSLKELKHVKVKETAALAVAQSLSDSSTDVFDFLEPELTSVKWSPSWLKPVPFDDTFQ